MSTNWLSLPRVNPNARVRLFCFPYSGASASIYYQWADILPSNVEVCPIQYPGHGTRVSEKLISQLPRLVDIALSALLPYFDRPFVFFGHSMGALVGFELIRQLQKANMVLPICFFPSGHGAPHLPDREPPMYNLPDEIFIEKLRFLGGTHEEILGNQELRELLLPILRADFEASETYQYQAGPLINTPICACGGLQDSFVPREDLDEWKVHTTHSFSSRLFPGDHFYLNLSKSLLLQVIAQEINRIIHLGPR